MKSKSVEQCHTLQYVIASEIAQSSMLPINIKQQIQGRSMNCNGIPVQDESMLLCYMVDGKHQELNVYHIKPVNGDGLV